MRPKTVGLVTYHHPHLKTEQVVQRLVQQRYDYVMYALPFTPRKARETRFVHRPDQSAAVAPQSMAEKHKMPYIVCADDTEIGHDCEVYLVLGAGILSEACVAGKKIINCHPGIIPSSRGLDSFKWALYEMKPLGVTLHYIDSQVDCGEIIAIVPTNIYVTDTMATLARRHYENEIDCLCRFEELLNSPQNPFVGIEPGEAKRRMSLGTEKDLARLFSEYTEKYGR